MTSSFFLKTARIITALLFFIPITLFFCDFADILPKQLHGLMHLQVVPAILAGSILVIIFLALLTLVFGRIYCSTICPLGVLQDIISRFSGRGKNKSKKKRWYKYSKPLNYLRYPILGICTVLLILGTVTPVLLLDPYSNFGRIAANLFRPVVMEGNNLINNLATKAGIYGMYHVSIYTVTILSLIIAIIALVTVLIMSLFRGRLFCNSICPVGSLLGLLSRFSILKISMNESKCNSCGLCERACKSQCIDSKQMKIDHSRCVACYNCLSRCKKNAIAYNFSLLKPVKKEVSISDTSSELLYSKETSFVPSSCTVTSRRAFLATTATVAISLPLVPAFAQGKKDISKDTPITPPGSKNLEHFKEKCTACHLCVTHCPQQILRPAGFTFGFSYLLKPHMVYINAYCNYECTVCSEICPNGAIKKLTTEEKKITQVGIAQFEKERCVVHTEGTDCGACSEHCPTQAVKMMPYKESLRLPEVTPDLCIGCGGCEYICPVVPVKAINVLANSGHKFAHKPEEEEMKQVEVNDFGF